MDHNALLTQLGYNVDEPTTAQIKRILNASDGVTAAQIITLNDHLRPHQCFVAMSSSVDRLKIKNVANLPETRALVDKIITEWASKNKIELEKVNETTYYILGRLK